VSEDSQGGPDVGGVGEEAAKLFGALADWARDHGPLLAGLNDHLVDDLTEHLATGAPECTYCPVCRTVHVLREAGPEVRQHLAVAAASLMQAAAGVLNAASADHPHGGAKPEGVQKIDLDDDGAWPE
jgi:hypothetical protein